MMTAVHYIKDKLQQQRSDKFLTSMIKSSEQQIVALNLQKLCIPRQKVTPVSYRSRSTSEEYNPPTIFDFFRAEYFKIIDVAQEQLNSRFLQPGIKRFGQMEEVILAKADALEEKIKAARLEEYPEIDVRQLQLQLSMLKSKQRHQPSCTAEVLAQFQAMYKPEREMFDQVQKLLTLLIVLPASSCEAERSFNCLRRLKTWLRSSMSQKRTTHLAILAVHKERLDNLDPRRIAELFVRGKENRVITFGNIKV